MRRKIIKYLIRTRTEKGSDGEVESEYDLKTGEYTYSSSDCHYDLPKKLYSTYYKIEIIENMKVRYTERT